MKTTSDANRTAIKAAGLSAAYAALGVGTFREAMITVDELLAYRGQGGRSGPRAGWWQGGCLEIDLWRRDVRAGVVR